MVLGPQCVICKTSSNSIQLVLKEGRILMPMMGVFSVNHILFLAQRNHTPQLSSDDAYIRSNTQTLKTMSASEAQSQFGHKKQPARAVYTAGCRHNDLQHPGLRTTQTWHVYANAIHFKANVNSHSYLRYYSVDTNCYPEPGIHTMATSMRRFYAFTVRFYAANTTNKRIQRHKVIQSLRCDVFFITNLRTIN